MRLHIELDDELVADIDRLAGPRGRSAFVRAALESVVRQRARWQELAAVAGAIGEDHDWDDDPSAWVRAQRQADPRRAG